MYKRTIFTLTILLSTAIFANFGYAKESSKDQDKVNPAHKNEVCTVVLKKLKSSFENLRTGKITDKKTAKVSNLLQTYRLFECNNDKLLFDVLACTNTQIMFLDECRKVKW